MTTEEVPQLRYRRNEESGADQRKRAGQTKGRERGRAPTIKVEAETEKVAT
jgi:hypothetical protein